MRRFLRAPPMSWTSTGWRAGDCGSNWTRQNNRQGVSVSMSDRQYEHQPTWTRNQVDHSWKKTTAASPGPMRWAWRPCCSVKTIHYGVEVTEWSTNKQHTLSHTLECGEPNATAKPRPAPPGAGRGRHEMKTLDGLATVPHAPGWKRCPRQPRP